jgi:hypothetical protein
MLVSVFQRIEAMSEDASLELAMVERVLYRISDRNHVDLERVDLSNCRNSPNCNARDWQPSPMAV